MDIESAVWFRRPANRQAPLRRRGSLTSPHGNQTHEDTWREWETGKVLGVSSKSPSATVFTVAIQYEVIYGGQYFPVCLACCNDNSIITCRAARVDVGVGR